MIEMFFCRNIGKLGFGYVGQASEICNEADETIASFLNGFYGQV